MMLRQTAARVLRLRATRGFQHIADPSRRPPPEPVATAVEPEFPLYRPEPEEKFSLQDLPKSLDDLPTEAQLQRMAKRQLTEKAIEDMPEYEEEDLGEFYENVVLSGAREEAVRLPQIEAPKRSTSPQERQKLLAALADRLDTPGGSGQSLVPALGKSVPKHVALTSALMQVAPEPRGAVMVPLGVVRQSEWNALFDSFAARYDATGAEVLLGTMERHGVSPSMELLDRVLELYAKRGATSEVARMIADFETVGINITDHHRDMIIASYVYGPSANAESAITLLASAEKMGQPFPQSSYNVVLSHLVDPTPTTHTDSRTRAMAWDLLASMRFAAHPTPSRQVYTTMIRACGDARDPQPERARDLWLEMTADPTAELQPTRAEYDAIIRALGSTKSTYLEAFDLLRQMLAKHHEATLVPFEEEDSSALSPWVPTMETFTALLEGTKRAGDLDRARWVVSEATELARASAITGHPVGGPDDEFMVGVFQTYAAWKPRLSRREIREAEAAEETAEEVVSAEDASSDLVEAEASSSVNAPQTSAEALREAELLFAQVVHDARAAEAGPTSVITHPFGGVKLTARLINSYLSIHLAHAPLAEARQSFSSTWAALAQRSPSTRTPPPMPNGWTYLSVLERCARGKQSRDDRAIAQQWGQETWSSYRSWSELANPALPNLEDSASRRRRWLVGLGERQIEKIWAAAIRLAALRDDLPAALGLLDEFTALYPAQLILDTYAPALRPALRMRMSDPSTTPEANIPPHLLFRDLDVLHQRLVRDDMLEGVGKVKWAVAGYEKALAKRRRWRVRGAGMRREFQKARKREERLAAVPDIPRLE